MTAHTAGGTADRSETVAGLAVEYAERRDPETLRRLRDVVRNHPTYRPDLDVPTLTAPLFEREAYDEVVAAVHERMPGAFLSPAAHGALAAAYDALGDATRAERERRTARLALESITSAGDGSADDPWTVLRISDEYDVLRTQGRRSRSQRLVERHGRRLDHHVCEDGSEAWFDVSLVGAR